MGLAQGWRKRQIGKHMEQNELISMLNESGLGKHLMMDEHGVIRTEPILRFSRLLIMQERKACADLMMRLHEERKHVHNYYHFAANEIMDREIP